jgi:hypothetical protein
MTNQQHPITPLPELVEQWRTQAPEGRGSQIREMWIAIQAAQWGADCELEACCELLNDFNTYHLVEPLRAARRPKLPSLKEQALEMLDRVPTHDCDGRWYGLDLSLIRHALEQLND